MMDDRHVWYYAHEWIQNSTFDAWTNIVYRRYRRSVWYFLCAMIVCVLMRNQMCSTHDFDMFSTLFALYDHTRICCVPATRAIEWRSSSPNGPSAFFWRAAISADLGTFFAPRMKPLDCARSKTSSSFISLSSTTVSIFVFSLTNRTSLHVFTYSLCAVRYF